MHPRSERGLLLKGLLKPLPKKGEVPDCLLVEPYTEEVVPANAAAVLAHLPSAGPDAAYCYAKPPGDAGNVSSQIEWLRSGTSGERPKPQPPPTPEKLWCMIPLRRISVFLSP